MKNKLFCLLVFSVFFLSIKAQTRNEIVVTAAPFLRISPDARAGGLGDQGVATSADAYSQFWNASKFLFGSSYSGAGISYTPYLNKLTNDIFLLNANYFTILDEEERSVVSASLYYFNMGEVELNKLSESGVDIQYLGKSKPNEFSIDLAYGIKLHDIYSMSVTARYIRSDLFNNISNDISSQVKAANSFAVDIAGYMQTDRDLAFGDIDGRFRAGWGIFNMGPKLDYSSDSKKASFLPTTLRLGGGYDFYFDDVNKLGVTLELARLLVPAPEKKKDPDNPSEYIYEASDKNFLTGMFSSFSNNDALKEVTYSLGAEYNYNNMFSGRAGYFYENPKKGGRQYATVGAGVKYQSFGLDLSYLISTAKDNNALDNTLRFGLTWDIGGETVNAIDNF